MKRSILHGKRDCSGQALLEFAVMLVMMMSIVLMMVVVLGAYGNYGWRILKLIGLKYP